MTGRRPDIAIDLGIKARVLKEQLNGRHLMVAAGHFGPVDML